MSYYKITYESDSLEGLTALQSGFSDRGVSTKDSANAENPGPPPIQQEENTDALSGMMAAPPTATEMSTSLSFLSEDTVDAPPSADVASTNVEEGGVVPPPPMEGSQDIEFDQSSPTQENPPLATPSKSARVRARNSK
jgi:hypothetical protein